MKQRYTVKSGIDRTALWEEKVRGKRVGMLTAASGVNKMGRLGNFHYSLEIVEGYLRSRSKDYNRTDGGKCRYCNR